ncbi:hypothetical protein RJ44_19960 [Alteromonas macleodii]|uniref:hypothetical protein n=1 Tax=Alteromonas macleodii TaxID=28108 RepID=UPI0005809706|nr:hypothetical protein [Alteromonas macleodii]KHT53275.1 hypothetical protein RJ44_19960 [Alteromonas macleodii]
MDLITIKDEVELIAKLIAIFVGLVGVWRAIFEMRQNRRQREVEHHWKQSSQAKSLVDDIKSDYRCASALQMLDWAGREYRISDERKEVISEEEFASAMRINDLKFTRKEAFVRDCFDRFLERLESIEHYIRIDLIRFSDVNVPLAYYAKNAQSRPYLMKFIRSYQYELAESFLNRFDK